GPWRGSSVLYRGDLGSHANSLCGSLRLGAGLELALRLRVNLGAKLNYSKGDLGSNKPITGKPQEPDFYSCPKPMPIYNLAKFMEVPMPTVSIDRSVAEYIDSFSKIEALQNEARDILLRVRGIYLEIGEIARGGDRPARVGRPVGRPRGRRPGRPK